MTHIQPMTEVFRSAAVALLERCNRDERLDLPISFESVVRPTNAVTEFASIDGGTLVGFATLPDDLAPEASLLVVPGARRRGVGRSLLEAVRTEVARRGFVDCLLVNDEASESGRAFLLAMGVPYEVSEYRLELDRSRIDLTRIRLESLRVRRAELVDRMVLTHIRASGFGDSIDESAPAIDLALAETKRHFYLAELDGEAIGMIRAGEWEGTGDITAFAVLPAFRGRGYGRQILLETVDTLIAAGWMRILIEVATDNENALGLYESCGFRVTNRYGYHRLKASGSNCA